MSVIRQLLFPGKKPKEIIETGDDDEIDTDPDAGKKKVRENLKSLVLAFDFIPTLSDLKTNLS